MRACRGQRLLPRAGVRAAVGALISAAVCAQVTRVDGGWRHTVAATASGVWAWGWNKFGQLGLGRTADVCTPTAVEALSGEGARMELVSCGWKHTLLVTEAGEFYAMGRGTNGQLGVPVPSDQCAPTASHSSTTLQTRGGLPGGNGGKTGALGGCIS